MSLNDRAEREETGRSGQRGHKGAYWSQDRLFQQLVVKGVIDEAGVNEKPRLRHCASCGVVGWAAWRDGWGDVVLVDDITLTPKGEYQSWMAGRPTFDHWMGGLDTRTPKLIRAFPASDSIMHRIRPEHRCGDPPPEHYPRPVRSYDPDAPPPF